MKIVAAALLAVSVLTSMAGPGVADDASWTAGEVLGRTFSQAVLTHPYPTVTADIDTRGVPRCQLARYVHQ